MSGVWVFHRGALGDSVLLWPRLRNEMRAGKRVTLVTDGSKARLAERELGVLGLDAESRRFTAMWREAAEVEIEGGVERVVTAVTGNGAWEANLARMFPGAAIERMGRPSRRMYGGIDATEGVALRQNPRGPVVVHIGAGSEEKRWPVVRWEELVRRLRGEEREVVVVAGEVEAERLSAEERLAFARMGAALLDDLLRLADAVKSARVFVGCDSGPTHLAAALGMRTVALFGPTDPEEWGPIGPAVEIVAPAGPAAMVWLGVDEATAAVGRVLAR